MEDQDALLASGQASKPSTTRLVMHVALPRAPGAGGQRWDSRHSLTLLPFRGLGLAALTTFAGVVCSARGGEQDC